jgi:3-hydroxybutyryl-CoA dehydratase
MIMASEASQPLGINLEKIHVDDSASCEWLVTAELIDAFAAFSFDDNPLHIDETFAKGLGFDGRVAHGMVAMSAISRLIGTKLPGPGSLWMSQEVHFAAPAYVGDTIQATVTVQNVSKSARVVILSTEAINKQTKLVILRGTAKVRIPVQE